MNFGPFIFLGSFVALLLSWVGLILIPQIQLKDLQPARDETTGVYYPGERLGIARQGAEVYRANGCNACHSQQIRQTGYEFKAVLEKAGNDPDVVAAALRKANPKEMLDEVADMYAIAEGEVLPLGPINLHRKGVLEQVFEGLDEVEAKVRFDVQGTGPDIEHRKWGNRITVAADYLYDAPAMPGNLRLGPDLTNIGARMPNRVWHLLHLYHPRTVVEKSMMPAYQHLFEVRPIGDEPSPDALALPEGFAPGEGLEVIPTEEAEQLVAYLLSLKAVTPLFEAPMAVAAE